MWGTGEYSFVSTRNLSNRLSQESHNFTIHVISQHSLLLAKSTEFFPFTIPEREAVDHGGDALVIPVQPIWTYSHHVRGRPYISSLPFTSSNPQCGKISILTGKFIYLLSISNRPQDHVLHYSLAKRARYGPFRAVMGFRHTIWTEEYSAKPFVTLQTCAYSTLPNGYGGLQRLSHVGQLGGQLRPIPLPIQNGEVVDVSWDEESGRLCLLISRSHGMTQPCPGRRLSNCITSNHSILEALQPARRLVLERYLEAGFLSASFPSIGHFSPSLRHSGNWSPLPTNA